jgi:hypothetical protein
MKPQATYLLVTISVSTLIFSCSDAEERATGKQISKPAFDLTMAKKQIGEIIQNLLPKVIQLE